MIEFLLNKKYIPYYPFISGVLMSVSFTIPIMWPLGFFGMIPFFAFLYQKNISLRKVFWEGLIFGLIFMGSVLSWFWSTYPLKWAGIENDLIAFFLLFVVWFFSSLLFALFISFWATVFYRLKNENKTAVLNLPHIFLAPSLWVVFEYIRATAFSLLWVSPVSLIGPHWTFGFLGYILAENNIFLSLASIGGIYLLSFVVVLVNIYIYQLLYFKTTTNNPKKKISYIIYLFIFIFIISFLTYTFTNTVENGKKLKVALVDTYLPSIFPFDKKIYSKHSENIKKIVVGMKNIKEKPDIVVLPEDSRFISTLSNLEKILLSKNIFQKETLFIDSSDALGNRGKIVFALEYFNTKNGSSYSRKTMLAPFGEYMPYTASFIARILGKQQIIENFNKERGFQNGKNLNNAVSTYKGTKIGALFCSEIVSNKLYGDITENGANILVNIASHSVFKGSPIIYYQTTKMAKVHAVQNNRYFVQSMNFAKSFIVNNKGNIIVKSKNTGYGVTYGYAISYKKNSLYNKIGDWVLFLSIIFLIAYTQRKFSKRLTR